MADILSGGGEGLSLTGGIVLHKGDYGKREFTARGSLRGTGVAGFYP